jgi:hypothetical protein
MKLRPQCAINAGTRLVAGPKLVAKGLDDVIGGDTNVRGAVFDHLHERAEDAGDRAKGWIGFVKTAEPVEVAEQFVSAVNEVNNHLKQRLGTHNAADNNVT